MGEVVCTLPTIGFNVEVVNYKNTNLTVWDIGGQEKIRPLWRYYYDNANGLMFVLDSSDTERIEEARDEIHRILCNDLLKDAMLLVFANKQDYPNAQSVTELSENLGLININQ